MIILSSASTMMTICSPNQRKNEKNNIYRYLHRLNFTSNPFIEIIIAFFGKWWWMNDLSLYSDDVWLIIEKVFFSIFHFRFFSSEIKVKTVCMFFLANSNDHSVIIMWSAYGYPNFVCLIWFGLTILCGSNNVDVNWVMLTWRTGCDDIASLLSSSR